MRKIKRQKPVEAILKQEGVCRIKLNANLLLHELGKMSDYKCAYCETHYEHESHKGRTPEKEHFYPKSKYPKLKDSWWNLFWSCPTCNSLEYKGNKFEKTNSNKRIIPLKPDDEGKLNGISYSFDNWFILNYRTGELKPHPRKNNKERAEWTIKLFGLNRSGLLSARLRILEKFLKNYDQNNYEKEQLHLNNWSYSFFIESWLKINQLPYKN